MASIQDTIIKRFGKERYKEIKKWLEPHLKSTWGFSLNSEALKMNRDFFKNVECIVTGTSGFLGPHFLEQLVNVGCKNITAMDIVPFENLSESEKTFIKENEIKYICSDLTNKNSLRKGLLEVSIVNNYIPKNPKMRQTVETGKMRVVAIHNASLFEMKSGIWDKLYAVNVTGCENFMDVMHEIATLRGEKVQVLLVGTMMANAPNKDFETYNESKPFIDAGPENPYGTSKYDQIEAFKRKIGEYPDLSGLIANPGAMYGPPASFILNAKYHAMNLLNYMALVQVNVVPDNKQERPYNSCFGVYSDTAKSIIHLLSNGEALFKESVNVPYVSLVGSSIPTQELVRRIDQYFLDTYGGPIQRLMAFMTKSLGIYNGLALPSEIVTPLLVVISELYEVYYNKPFIMTEHQFNAGGVNFDVDNSLLFALGFEPDFETVYDAVPPTIDYFVNQGTMNFTALFKRIVPPYLEFLFK